MILFVGCLVLFLGATAVRIGDNPSVDCKSKPQSSYPFCDTTLSPEERASDLVGRLNNSELINQTSSIAPAISRLGIKDYNWRSNCLHGWSASGGHWSKDLKWTVFPAPVGLGATFDPDLLKSVGAATADEGRALHNVMLALFKGSSTEAAGLNCFSPNVNLLRDPRWGRLQESFSEDPFLLSVQGAAYTTGLQTGESTSKYLKVAACAKHYVVHSGPDDIRAHFTAVTSIHDLYDTYLEAFRSQVYASKVAQIMPAYSGFNCSNCKSSNGAPDAANGYLLNNIMRTEFETPNISIISDNGGVAEVYETHHFAKSEEEGAAMCMNATTDLDLGHDEIYPKYLPKALEEGIVTIETIKKSVWRSFYLRILLGDFDPIDMVPYQKIDGSHLNTKENQNLNIVAATKSFVLLKNKDSFLPISLTGIKKIAVIGPNANSTHTPLSNYEGIPEIVVTVYEGIRMSMGGSEIEVTYQPGCKDTKCSDDSGFNDAVNIAKNADLVVMVMGLDGSLEGEGHDRVAHNCKDKEIDVLALPGCQGDLVSTIADANKNVVLLLMNGGPLSLGDIYSNDNVKAIMEVFYPGALGGIAVPTILVGNESPAGRMPVTTYTSSKEVPDPTDYNMNTSPGRTYRYYSGTPEVPFGFGLSYTTFSYSKLSLSSGSVKQCDSVKVSVDISNTGKRDSDEVIQIYISPPTIKDKSFFPKIQLVGFNRQTIKADNNPVTVGFTINPYLMGLVDDDGVRYIFPGEYIVTAAGSLPGKSVVGGEIKGESGSFKIEGSNPMKVLDCPDAPKCIAC